MKFQMPLVNWDIVQEICKYNGGKETNWGCYHPEYSEDPTLKEEHYPDCLTVNCPLLEQENTDDDKT